MMVCRSASFTSRSTYLSMASMVGRLRAGRRARARSPRGSAAPGLRSPRRGRAAGLVISARPMASICCSPPESWLPMFLRALQTGKRAKTRSSVQGAARCGGWRRRRSGSRARSGWGRSAGLRARARCRPADAVRPRSRRCAAVKVIAPARRRREPDDGAHGGGLAHAVAPEQRHHLALLDSSSTPNSTWLAP